MKKLLFKIFLIFFPALANSIPKQEEKAPLSVENKQKNVNERLEIKKINAYDPYFLKA